MIPADVASRMQVTADTVLRPVAPTQEISDKLSDLKTGQRVMAEIQALLPNGTYRAVINQRNITLALPFAAKSGDSLELLVTQNQGKTALAVISHQGGQNLQTSNTSVSATLSRAAQLISSLLGNNKEAGADKALTLNNNQPLLNLPSTRGSDILPMLRQALSQSGMFYESHQAQWLAGKLPASALLAEPQGKLSATNLPTAEGKVGTPETTGQTAPMPGQPGREMLQARPNVILVQESSSVRGNIEMPGNQQTQPSVQTAGQIIAAQTQGIVQQQLSALAAQHFAWQGQIWLGQELQWEIEDQTNRQPQPDEEPTEQWQTGLRLKLPLLGMVDARITLHGDQVSIVINADNMQTVALMRTQSEMFRQQLTDAGLTLTTIGIAQPPSTTPESQP